MQILNCLRLKLHYIYASDGLFAIYVMNGETDTMYYIHKDYLGSYDVITDEGGIVLERLNFDPWGRRRKSGRTKSVVPFRDFQADCTPFSPRTPSGAIFKSPFRTKKK